MTFTGTSQRTTITYTAFVEESVPEVVVMVAVVVVTVARRRRFDGLVYRNALSYVGVSTCVTAALDDDQTDKYQWDDDDDARNDDEPRLTIELDCRSCTWCCRCWRPSRRSSCRCYCLSSSCVNRQHGPLAVDKLRNEIEFEFDIRYYVPINTKLVTSKTFFPANLLATTEDTKANTSKANIRPEHKNATTQNNGSVFTNISAQWHCIYQCRAVSPVR